MRAPRARNRVFGKKKKTHTHTFSGCSPGCCLARRTNSVEFGFFDFVASSQHATRRFCTCMDEHNACDILVCARIRAVNTCQEQLRAFGTMRDRDSSFHFHLSIVEIIANIFDHERRIDRIYVFIRKRWIIILLTFQFLKTKNRERRSRTSSLLNIYNIVCRSCVLSLFIHRTMCSLTVCAWTTTSAHYVVRWRRQAACISKKRKNRKKENERCCVYVCTPIELPWLFRPG